MANFKFVKSATALVLGASVLTTAVIVPGANASAKTTYKVNKNGTLVDAKTNKTVKGYVTYKGKLYKNGKKLTGLFNKKYYYKNGVKATGTYQGAYYVKGAKKVTTGTYNGAYYVKGIKKVTTGTYNKAYYVAGKKVVSTGTYNKAYYVDGKKVVNTGLYQGKYYKDGVLNVGFALYNNELYKDAIKNVGLAINPLKDGKAYYDAILANGTYPDATGVEKAFENGVEVGAKVKSVEAINAGEIKVTFNKTIKEDSVIANPGTDDTLVDGLFTLNGLTTLDAANAELSEDGRTLTIYPATGLAGAYTLVLNGDKAKTTGNELVGKYETVLSVKDATRASITGVKKVSKYVYDLTLSEPVAAASLTGITAKLADGTSVLNTTGPADNNKTIRVTLANTTAADKEVTITVPSLTDLAGNVSVPLTQKVTVSDADKTPATVTSAVATSSSTIDVTFSEPVTVTTAKFLFNGVGVTSVLPKSGDTTGTKYVVTLPSAQTTAAYLELQAGATTDLSGNATTASSTNLISFAIDKVAPTIQSSKVTTDASGVNYLVLQLSEKVAKNATTPTKVTDLTLKYQDDYGVTQTITVPKTNVNVDSTDASVVKVKLYDNAGTPAKVPTGKAYTVDFGAGYFEDAFKNESEAKTVSFTNTGSAESNSRLGATVVTASGVDLVKGAYVTVNFDKAVNATDVKNASNYTVEGSTVNSVELVSNSAAGAQVKVYLANDTITNSGKYNVTVKGIKGYDSNVLEMNSTTTPVALTENVGAKVASKVVTFTGTATNVAVTYDEAVKEATVSADNDYVLYIDGVKVVETPAITVTGDQSTTAKTTINFAISKDLSAAIAAGKSVKLVATDNINLVDENGNKVNTSDIVLK